MVATKADLINWVYDALLSFGGKARIVAVAQHIWEHHEQELQDAGDLFFTWQYDMRWAAQELRDTGKCKPASEVPRGVWQLSKTSR
ncbi:MAG: hypothetical protein MI824_06855 [Hyphomicrobiales bacterium]|nr:hypothetical protein [Hyphomicrobiales bacterium]